MQAKLSESQKSTEAYKSKVGLTTCDMGLTPPRVSYLTILRFGGKLVYEGEGPAA